MIVLTQSKCASPPDRGTLAQSAINQHLRRSRMQVPRWKKSMKPSILNLFVTLLAAVAMATAASTQASAQNPATPTAASATPGNLNPAPSDGDAPTPDRYTPQTEEEQRYLGFFQKLRAWDENANNSGASANSDSPEISRTRFEKESGLTPSEAADVKRIVSQYMEDDQNQEKMMAGIRNRVIADYPNSWKTVLNSDPEYVNLLKLRAKLLSRAIAELSSDLGPNRFPKLDQYTRHYDNKSKASKSRKQEYPSPSGAQM